MYCSLFLEVSRGSLAGLAFKAGNKMPALLVMQPKARGSLPPSSGLAGDIVFVELGLPWLILIKDVQTNREIKLTKSHCSELLCLSVCLPASPPTHSTLLLLCFFSPLPNKTKIFFKEITFGNWNFYVFSYLANVCSITFWEENAFSSLRCSVLLPKCIVFRLYANHSHKDHVWSHLPTHWCLPIFGKFITISKLPKVLINNSSGDFYSSLLKGHRGVVWYFGQKAAAWLVALEQEHGIEQLGLCVEELIPSWSCHMTSECLFIFVYPGNVLWSIL